MEELNMIIDMVKQEMDAALRHLDHAYLKIRAGRATTTMVQDVMVEYYGSVTPINQVANVSIPDAMTIAIQPWDKSAIKAIEKGIIESNIGLNPSNNGDLIILNVPPLTEERRIDLVKQAKSEGESTKVTVRNARQDGMKELKKLDGISEDLVKDNEEKIQTITDGYIKKIDEVFKVKEKDIMTI